MADWAEEGARRIAAARGRMEAAGLDALLLISSANAAYLSGYRDGERSFFESTPSERRRIRSFSLGIADVSRTIA